MQERIRRTLNRKQKERRVQKKNKLPNTNFLFKQIIFEKWTTKKEGHGSIQDVCLELRRIEWILYIYIRLCMSVCVCVFSEHDDWDINWDNHI